jgi:hypothetical protein
VGLIHVSADYNLLDHVDNSPIASNSFPVSSSDSSHVEIIIINCDFVITAFPLIKNVQKMPSALDLTKDTQCVSCHSSAEKESSYPDVYYH